MHTDSSQNPAQIRDSLIARAMRAFVAFFLHREFLRFLLLAVAFLSWAWRVVCLVVATWLVFGPRELTPWLYLAASLLMVYGDPMRPLVNAVNAELNR